MSGRLHIDQHYSLDSVIAVKSGYVRFTVQGSDKRYKGLWYKGFPYLFVYDLNQPGGELVAWIEMPDDDTTLTQAMDRRDLWKPFSKGGILRLG